MSLEPGKKIPLNRSYAMRVSQAVIQFGVGAVVDFPNQTLMTAAPEYWQERIVKIHDERLEKLLHVEYFGVPGGQDEAKYREGISYARFPEWYFCPNCRRFMPIKDWIKEYREKKPNQSEKNPYMTKSLKCPVDGADLIVSRVVTVCENGHIDDFPWIQWVHSQNMNGGSKPVCRNPKLTFTTSASSTEGLEGLIIKCESCQAKASLKGAFDAKAFEDLERKHQGKYNFRCTGRHPWKNTYETCGKFPRAMQRSSSAVYFPVTASSLVIPPYSSILTKKVENSSAFEKQKNTIAEFKKTLGLTIASGIISGVLPRYAQEIALEIGEKSIDEIRSILERKWLSEPVDQEYSTYSVKYRAEEYEALSGRVAVHTEEYGDFTRESTDISLYDIPYIKEISLIHKIREVQALTGFSRIKPVEHGDETGSIKEVSVKLPDTNWYPAYEVRGEGIFIEFDEEAIQNWIASDKTIQRRVDIINDNYLKSYYGTARPRKISAKFLLLHTVSHLLIKKLSFECGYSIASLKERLYCSDADDGYVMSGILIYTASGDSEGTLGGLVRQGRPDTFPSIYKKAIEAAMTCSNDPVCSLSQGQGRDSLNLSACYSCSLIPETSCEEFNVFLDRGVVVGTYENRNIGFYYKQLYAGEPWQATDNYHEVCIESDKKKHLLITNSGIDMSEESLPLIFESLKEWSENSTEQNLLSVLEIEIKKFPECERPNKDCTFQITGETETFGCDLMWFNSKVALFTEDNEESYEKAKNSDWCCFLASDLSVTAKMIISALGCV